MPFPGEQKIRKWSHEVTAATSWCLCVRPRLNLLRIQNKEPLNPADKNISHPSNYNQLWKERLGGNELPAQSLTPITSCLCSSIIVFLEDSFLLGRCVMD